MGKTKLIRDRVWAALLRTSVFFVQLADTWYETQLDALTVVGDVLRARCHPAGFRHLSMPVRDLLMDADEMDWIGVKEAVNDTIDANINQLNYVHNMIVTMGIEGDAAAVLLGLLCTTDTDAGKDVRRKMFANYSDYSTLQALVGIPVVPFKESDVIDAECTLRKVQFRLAVMELLPLTGPPGDLVHDIAIAKAHIEETSLSTGILQAAGIGAYEVPFEEKKKKKKTGIKHAVLLPA